MQSPITDLNQIKQLAAHHHDDFEVMRHMLQIDDDIDDAALDRLVNRLAAPIIEAIDCTRCANCCRSLDVYLTEGDMQQIAGAVHIPLSDIQSAHVDHEAAAHVGEWGKFRHKPCPFLKGKCCSVYSHRPVSCREYPAFTPDFRWTLTDTIAGAAHCPIIYNVLARMLKEVDKIVSNERL